MTDDWPAAWPPLPLLAGEVHVWRVALDGAMEPPTAWLDDAERDRAARFRFDGDRRRWVAARRGLRAVLAAYVEREPGAVAIAVAAGGKPGLADPGPAFSLSHAGDWALVAVADDRPVGVDLEPQRDLPDLASLAARTLGASEHAAWAALGPERVAAFFRAWTRKEALLKAHGMGLAIEPCTVEVGVGPLGPRVIALDGGRWAIADLRPAPGVVGAVAAPGEGLVVRSWSLPHAVCHDC